MLLSTWLIETVRLRVKMPMNTTYCEQQEGRAIYIHSCLWISRKHLIEHVKNMFINSHGIKAEFWLCERLSLRLMTNHTRNAKYAFTMRHIATDAPRLGWNVIIVHTLFPKVLQRNENGTLLMTGKQMYIYIWGCHLEWNRGAVEGRCMGPYVAEHMILFSESYTSNQVTGSLSWQRHNLV